jgi:two-component system, chemotaxis family, sensor kinase CheA
MALSANDSMLELYLHENTQLLEELESLLLAGEKKTCFSAQQVNEIFRILHTIKGSSDMMGFDAVARLSHAVEDLFSYLRGHSSRASDFHVLCDMVLASADFISGEMAKIRKGSIPDGDASALISRVSEYYGYLLSRRDAAPEKEDAGAEGALQVPLARSDQPVEYFKAAIKFRSGCQMEHIRVFGIIDSLRSLCLGIISEPRDILSERSCGRIASDGAVLWLASSAGPEALGSCIGEALFLESMSLEKVSPDAGGFPAEFLESGPESSSDGAAVPAPAEADARAPARQNFVSVNLDRLDQLMDLVGEIVIAEAMAFRDQGLTVRDAGLAGKSAAYLRKLTGELQDIVMSMRMVPVSAVFRRMERILRDTSKKTGKKAEIDIIGEWTELDRNMIDRLADPLMHIVRNAVDHGLEPARERLKQGKEETGRITLEACSTGGDVLITVSDDGRGLDRDLILKKAASLGLLERPAGEYTDAEVFAFVFQPGFSTRDEVTELSGRGVGMDVVAQNVRSLAGSVSIESEPGKGTRFLIRLPLTLSIIEGMHISVGSEVFIIPLLSIQESFRADRQDIVVTPDGREMILRRGKCIPVLRLREMFGEREACALDESIFIEVESGGNPLCLVADALLGQQPVVVKPVPAYIIRHVRHVDEVAGCTILGDGRVSLILDVNGLGKVPVSHRGRAAPAAS